MKERKRLTYRGQVYHDPMYKKLQEMEDAVENGELVRLPCKPGEIFYAVGMYGCALNHCKGDLAAQISKYCDDIHGDCWRCQYSYPTIAEHVCIQVEIESDGIRVEGYTPDEIFTDKGQAETQLKELEKKAWKTINQINP